MASTAGPSVPAWKQRQLSLFHLALRVISKNVKDGLKHWPRIAQRQRRSLANPPKTARSVAALRQEILNACLSTSVVSDADIPLSFFFTSDGAIGSSTSGDAPGSPGSHHHKHKPLITDPLSPEETQAWRMESLVLKNGARLTSKYLKKVMHRCGDKLQRLDLTGCLSVDDATLRECLRSCPQLQSLTLAGCRKLTDGSAASLLRFGKQIRELDMGGCYCVGETGLRVLLSSASSSSPTSSSSQAAPSSSTGAVDVSGSDGARPWDCVVKWAEEAARQAVAGHADGVGRHAALPAGSVGASGPSTPANIETESKSESKHDADPVSSWDSKAFVDIKAEPLLPQLNSLVLSGIPAIGQQWVLNALASRGTRLHMLGLGHLHVPSDLLAAFLQRVGGRVHTLQLAWSPAVATRTMRDIAVSCPQLARLDISGVSGVREHAILELIRSRAAVDEESEAEAGASAKAPQGSAPASSTSAVSSSSSSSSAASASSSTHGTSDQDGQQAAMLGPGEAEVLSLPRTLRLLQCKHTTLTREAVIGLRREFPMLRILM